MCRFPHFSTSSVPITNLEKFGVKYCVFSFVFLHVATMDQQHNRKDFPGAHAQPEEAPEQGLNGG